MPPVAVGPLPCDNMEVLCGLGKAVAMLRAPEFWNVI
jgi:hypothetical protein